MNSYCVPLLFSAGKYTPPSMASELPEDLIRQVQQATRAEAGLPHYDPTRDIPPLPSISETVASFDASPPYLRCKNCRGRFLRGVQSVLCVYCGRPNDAVRGPICFTDTVAYRWLLESLHLDGSEIVEPPLERGDSDRGHSTPRNNQIRLSDLLKFKISWPADDKRENNFSSEKLKEKSYLNFSGIDLDNFFHDSRRLDASNKPEEHEVKSNDVMTAEIKAVASNDLSFFENVPSSELAIQSSKEKDTGDFSEWQADFQSANTGNQFDGSKSFDLNANSAVGIRNENEISKQPDPVSGSPVDFSSHLDTVFGSGKDSNNAKWKDDFTASPSPSAGDWTSDNMWDNLNPKASPKTKQTDAIFTAEEALPQDNMNSVDLSYQLDSMFGQEKELKDGKEKSNLSSFPTTNDWPSDNLWNNLSSETSQQLEPHVATVRLTDALPQDKAGNLSASFDWFQVDQWQNNTNAPENNVVSRDDVSISDWDDFSSPIPVQYSSNNAPAESRKKSIAASGSTSELYLFDSENNLEEMDFGSFSQEDTFPSSSSSKERVSTELNSADVTGSDSRAINTKSVIGGSVVQSATSADFNSVSTQTREDVKLLLSQMHDLSFMLEDKLSLPAKSDGFNYFP